MKTKFLFLTLSTLICGLQAQIINAWALTPEQLLQQQFINNNQQQAETCRPDAIKVFETCVSGCAAQSSSCTAAVLDKFESCINQVPQSAAFGKTLYNGCLTNFGGKCPACSSCTTALISALGGCSEGGSATVNAS